MQAAGLRAWPLVVTLHTFQGAMRGEERTQGQFKVTATEIAKKPTHRRFERENTVGSSLEKSVTTNFMTINPAPF